MKQQKHLKKQHLQTYFLFEQQLEFELRLAAKLRIFVEWRIFVELNLMLFEWKLISVE